MTVQRLVSSTSDDFERALLRSARGEGPSPQAVRKAAAALTGAAVLTGVGAAAAASGASLASKAAASGAVTKGIVALMTPWVAAGVVTSGAVIGVVTVVAHRADVEVLAPEVSASAPYRPRGGVLAPPRAAASQPAPESSAPETIEELAARSVPIAPQPSASAPASASAAPPPAPSASAPLSSAPAPEVRSSVTDEIRAMDQAREALASGKSQEALALLDRMRHDFPRGALSLDAEVLRIEAYAASGRRVRAIYLSEQFLQAHPNDPHAPRVRSMLAAMSNR
ncbi:MAG: outer membrane protein assembly factor BamD [Deltaproteobacteria bacterium]|nr:outer membrane protein assembly factor BamD [Deltaproteobacteria bacterium]